jgi:signal peptidase I
MSGSGAWDGFGSPPWDPADPVPDLDATQAIPGLGALPGPAGASGHPPDYPPGQGWPAPGPRWDQPPASPPPWEPPGPPAPRGMQPQPGPQWGPPPSGRHWTQRQPEPGWNQRSEPRWDQPDGAGDPWAGPPRGTSDSLPRDTGTAGWNGPAGNGGGGSDPRTGDDLGDSSPGDGGARGAGPDGPRDGGSHGGKGKGRGAGNGGATAAHAKRGGGRRRRRSFWRELPVLIVVALVLAVLIKTFAIQAFFIPSASMENTLEIGDRVLINKIVYHLRPIHRGDIVVFDGTGSWDFNNPQPNPNIFARVVDNLEGVVGITHDSSIYIKRVIGLPGDRVACCNAKGQVTVNGVPLSESSYLYPGNAPSTQSFRVTVPAGSLWVMGDHRAVSYDSRGHMGDPGGGAIPESGVLGRAFVIIWPPSRWGFLNIPATFEQPRLNASAGAGSNAAAGGSSAALLAAMDNGTPVRPAGSPLPLALGFTGAIPLTWLQRTIRLRRKTRRARPSS